MKPLIGITPTPSLDEQPHGRFRRYVLNEAYAVAIETAGSRALGVNTSLDEISLGIFSDRSSLAGFQVANPAGFDSSYFLRLDDGALNMSLFNVLEDTIEIDQLNEIGSVVRPKDGIRDLVELLRARFQPPLHIHDVCIAR